MWTVVVELTLSTYLCYAEAIAWYVAATWESCDATCLGVGGACSDADLSKTANSETITHKAFSAAGFTCNSFYTACKPSNCQHWGAPYLHTSSFSGSTANQDGQAGFCGHGNEVAQCSQSPSDRQHRRLCPCFVTTPSPTPSPKPSLTQAHTSAPMDCVDIEPPSDWPWNTCQKQQEGGHCDAKWFMDIGFCLKTCGRCLADAENDPDNDQGGNGVEAASVCSCNGHEWEKNGVTRGATCTEIESPGSPWCYVDEGVCPDQDGQVGWRFSYKVCEVTFTYIGCYKDDDTTRDLEGIMSTSSTNDPAECAGICKGYQYFGLQYSTYCLCGNGYGSYGEAAGDRCDMQCAGDRSTSCGGSWVNSVYKIEAPATMDPTTAPTQLTSAPTAPGAPATMDPTTAPTQLTSAPTAPGTPTPPVSETFTGPQCKDCLSENNNNLYTEPFGKTFEDCKRLYASKCSDACRGELVKDVCAAAGANPSNSAKCIWCCRRKADNVFDDDQCTGCSQCQNLQASLSTPDKAAPEADADDGWIFIVVALAASAFGIASGVVSFVAVCYVRTYRRRRSIRLSIDEVDSKRNSGSGSQADEEPRMEKRLSHDVAVPIGKPTPTRAPTCSPGAKDLESIRIIFSHSSRNKSLVATDIVETMISEFVNLGIPRRQMMYQYSMDIPPNRHWADVWMAGLLESEIVIIIMEQAYLHSEACVQEFLCSQDKDQAIVICSVDELQKCRATDPRTGATGCGQVIMHLKTGKQLYINGAVAAARDIEQRLRHGPPKKSSGDTREKDMTTNRISSTKVAL